MKKFSPVIIRKRLLPEEIENSLFLLSKSNCGLLLINENRALLNDLLYGLSIRPLDRFKIVNNFLKQEDISPPLELLWILHVQEYLRITTFLHFHPDYCSKLQCFFSDAIKGIILEDKYNLIPNILSTVLTTILNLKNNEDFKNLCEEVILKLLSELAGIEFSNSLTRLDGALVYCAIASLSDSSLSWNYFSDLKKEKGIWGESMKDFALTHLEKLISSGDDVNDTSFVIGNHTKLWISEKFPEQSKSFVNELLSLLDPQLIVTEMNNTVRQGSYKWKNFLFVISMFVKEQQNSELMKGLVDNWLISAIEEKDKSLLFTLLIVARHCCCEKARYFINYPSWFGSLSFRTVASFSFFFECLSQIVPDEPPMYLKIHVNKVPSAPTSCQGQLLDYLALAKTRLSDLNETTDYIGLFNDYHETDEEGQEADVQKAITLFQEAKDIPKPLLEAAVFRRQYYEKTFLKRLLSVPEKEDELRAKLIKKLHSAGKIPSASYRSWSSRSLPDT